MIASTKTERMLDTYDFYTKDWEKNLHRTLKVRDSLTGSVHKSQRDSDKSIQEKLDDEFLHEKQMR